MPALNFRKQFAPKILDGSKLTTIRREWKHPIEVGDKLSLFTGLRTADANCFAYTICTDIQRVTIHTEPVNDKIVGYVMTVNDEMIPDHEVDALSSMEGFTSPMQMFRFFEDLYGLPFEGVMICWQELTDEKTPEG